MKKSFEEVLEEVYAESIAIAKASEALLNRDEEVVKNQDKLQSTQDVLKNREEK